MQNRVRGGMNGHLQGFLGALHQKYHEPVRQQPQPQPAPVEHVQSDEHTVNLLREAYDKQSAKNKQAHKKRIEPKLHARVPSTAPEPASRQPTRKRRPAVTFDPQA